jgi:hypothetical protein
MAFTKVVVFAVCLAVSACTVHAAPATMDRQPDGIILHLEAGDLRVQVLSDTVVRSHSPRSRENFSAVPQLTWFRT